MRTLVIGSGAREHAIVRALKKDPEVAEIFCAPGNAGIATQATLLDSKVDDVPRIVELCKEHQVDLVIVGPEVALAAGLIDELNKENILAFGPTKSAAMLETSKAFAKKVMKDTDVQTAKSFERTALNQVEAALNSFNPPYVVKDDQLAAGKGVLVTNNLQDAIEHAKNCLAKTNGKVVIEEFLEGREVSILFISDGNHLIPLEPAQDYKRAFDKDEGPNTGGMGAYSPVTWVDKNLVEQVKTQIAQPVIDYLKNNETPFIGVLYVGLIITNEGPKVIEFNARFGDPETQVILERLKTPITQIFLSAIKGELNKLKEFIWSENNAVVVIRAANGYPENPEINDEISLPKNEKNAYILHAGTKTNQGKLLSSGGRVLAVVGTGSDLAAARSAAYELNSKIDYENSYFRSDIADMER